MPIQNHDEQEVDEAHKSTHATSEEDDKQYDAISQIAPCATRPTRQAVNTESLPVVMDEMFSKTIYPKDYNYSEVDKQQQ